VELVLSLLALRDNLCPPTINLEKPDPACDLNYTPNKPQERRLSAVMSNSFGFGGHNVTLAVRKFRE
jgi:3-oxoacyl-[acyl-carrier-protein] synthase II